MGKYDEPDNQIEGQLSLENYEEASDGLFAVSRVFARARKDMTLSEQKAFVYAISNMRFKEEAKSNIVRLDKKKLAKIVGVNSDSDHLSVDLNRSIGDMAKHSYIKIADNDHDFYDNGFVINRVTILKNMVRIKFDDEYLPLFTGLSRDYVTMWSHDIYQMTSERSVKFYEYLRRITDSRYPVNDVLIGVRRLKEMFDIPETGKGSYMREKGGFDRSKFEKRIIEPLCNDLKNCKMVNLVVQPDGAYYEKVKKGNRVDGYRFYWTYTAHPGVASAEEVKQIQERVDKNPEVLKVAKDIVKGEKRKNRTGAGNQFNNFEQNSYDFDKLEREILDN